MSAKRVAHLHAIGAIVTVPIYDDWPDVIECGGFAYFPRLHRDGRPFTFTGTRSRVEFLEYDTFTRYNLSALPAYVGKLGRAIRVHHAESKRAPIIPPAEFVDGVDALKTAGSRTPAAPARTPDRQPVRQGRSSARSHLGAARHRAIR